MAVTTDLLIPALREVRETEAALADRFRSHLAVTPPGEHREALERRAGDARGHVYRIDEHLRALRPRGGVQTVLGNAWHLTGRAARLPFDAAMAVPQVMLRGQGKTTKHQLLKNAEDEYAVTALAVAVCRAAERMAQDAEDAGSSDLLNSIRRDGEEALEELGSSLEQRAEEVVAAETADGSPAAGITRTVRAWSNWLRESAERVPGVERLQSAPQGAFITEAELPIPDYRRRSTKSILDRLPHLPQADLATVDAYERSHAGRPVILSRIADLLGHEPWPGYDSMTADEILKRLQDTESGLAWRVLDYERRHQARATILSAVVRAYD
ncbi:hypothetical protein ACH492_08445 [Streptomyces sp. NPDC019443]|uniref:hypothetical protein n=1 Tax=Streptomyces sp. NPDC019443 TaxID=3365061 RepID=UPI00379331C5